VSYRIAITPGEPAGIGPDLCIKVAQQPPPGIELVLIADPSLFEARAKLLGLPLALREFIADKPVQFTDTAELSIIPVELNTLCTPGQLDAMNAGYVLDTLRLAVQQIQAHNLDALVTGPVHKGIINEAGGKLIDLNGNPRKYNQANTLIEPGLIAGDVDAVDKTFQILNSI